MRFAGLLLVTTALVSQPALAGDEVLYDAPPAWVDHMPLETEARDPGTPIVLLDQQARIESGRLWTYVDTAIALDSPQALTQFGTLSAEWMPDKGDLIVHSAQLIRGGEVIDLLAGNQRFEILRREQGLEARLLSGALTATMTVPGARVGDVVRLAYSTTLSDQAMGADVQWQSGLVADPFPLGDGRVRVSWPQDLAVTRLHHGDAIVSDPEVVDGFNVWTVEMPVAELGEFPYDAPSRYQLGELLQVTTYADYQSVSANMAQHYGVAGSITPGGDLAGEVARIKAASNDELTRAALALQLVQDDISYLLNGLDGGNYLPQSPEETWQNRFGDCKAKSVLLLAILQELGIDSEAVLIRTQGGDVLPLLAPMPGNFDHVIVRAEIGGKNYWLDGTSAGARIDTIDTVPRFFYALPLRAAGSGLVKLDERPQSTPDRIVRLKVDQSAGVRLPALFEIAIEFRGVVGGQWRAFTDAGDGEMRDNAVYAAVASVVGQAQLIDEQMSYDVEKGVALVTARGALPSPWERDDIEYELNNPAQAARAVAFSADRARTEWRNIPLRLNGPAYFTSEFEITLPDDGQAFELKGVEQAHAVIGGVEVGSTANLAGNRFTLSQSMRSISEELAADEIADARRALARFMRTLPVLQSAGGVRELWEYFGEERALLAPFEAIYADAIADAARDDTGPHLNRAAFRMSVYDHKGALEDVEAALAIEASRDLYVTRAYLRRELGDLDGALADYQLAEELSPDGSTYSEQVELLALLGQSEDGLALAEEYQDFANDPVAEANLMATAYGWSGSVEEGISLLQTAIRRRPGDGTLLNALCWKAATWNVVNEERLATCVDAVERSQYSAAALDSRAMAHFRMGNFDAARADVDAALLAEPSLTPSLLLRGIIKIEQGDEEAGRKDIALALAMNPSLEANYRAWGLEF